MIKKTILIFSIIFLAIFLTNRLYAENNLIFGKKSINKEKFNNIISEKEEYKDQLDVKHNGESIPYDKTNNFYLLSQVELPKYKGNINIENFKIGILNNEKEKDDIISEDDELILLAYNNKYYKIINLKMTYFPVIKLDNFSEKVIVYDNDGKRQTLNVQEYSMSYHIRGASTSVSEKPSYKLNILDSKGNKKAVSLLNMRKDDDWVLNSMTLDKTHMLEKIGFNIWSQMNEYEIELKYIELFIDDEYKGIYYLQEPADFKTYAANNKSLIISIKSWQNNIKNPILFSENLEYSTIIDEFELDSKIEGKQQIDLLRRFSSDIKNLEYYSDTELNYDIENISSYSLFVNLISAIDNTYKNQKVLFRYKDGKYNVELYPWDLDWSQNNENINKEYNFFEILENANVPKEIVESENYNNIIKNKYEYLRKTIYNEQYLFALIEKNYNDLTKTGAILREETKWGDRDLEKSVTNLKNYYTDRIKMLDEYYGGI